MKTLKDTLMQKNILYIHGLGSSKNSSTFKTLKKNFPQYNWVTDTFDLLDVNETISKINKLLKENNISTVIGSSLGAFYTLAIKNSLAKIVINPCMHPSIEIPKLVTNQPVPVTEFESIENDTYSSIDGEMRLGTFGIFGTEDELFSYIKEFKSKYGNRFIRISDKHRLNYKNLISTIQFAFDRFKDINKKINESIINEHFTNIVINDEDKTKLDEYKDVVYNILQKAYEPIGGILGCDNVDMLVNDSDFWKLFTRNGKVYACVIYTFKRGGRKLMYCGTDGTPEGKKALYTIIKDDLRLIDRKAWAEVSGAMEHIYIDKHGAIPIPAEVAQQLLEDKPFIKIHDDGFHYDRYIDGEVHTKIMVGIIPK